MQALFYNRSGRSASPQGFETANTPEIKQLFRDYGYAINDSDDWDKPSRNVIYAFQLHFRPQKLTGKMDLETYAILRALHNKYVENPN